MEVVLSSGSADETEAVAARVASRLRPGDVVTVSGELGSGKTTFVRGACRELGVTAPVTSPTFTIGHRYRGAVEVSHLDLFRQIELIEPTLVATLGNFATKLLSGRPAGITRVHGQEQEVTLGARRVLLYPLYHPAAALYTPSMLEVLESDFARIPDILSRAVEDPAGAFPAGASPAGASPARARADDLAALGAAEEIEAVQLGLF